MHKDLKQQIIHLINLVEPMQCVMSRTNKHGSHYCNCIWYFDDATEGPDTCVCQSIDGQFAKIENLMQNYCHDMGVSSLIKTITLL